MSRYLIILFTILSLSCKPASKTPQSVEAERPHYVVISRTAEAEHKSFQVDVNSPQKEQLAILEDCFSPIGIDFTTSWVMDHKFDSQFNIQGEETLEMGTSMYRNYKQAKAYPIPEVLYRHGRDEDFIPFCGIPSPKVGQSRMIKEMIQLFKEISDITKMNNKAM